MRKENLLISFFGIILALGIVSCGPRYVPGKISTLPEVYEEGLITKNDLLNIAYIYNVRSYYTNDYTGVTLKEPDINELDENIIYSIKLDFLEAAKEEVSEDTELDDLLISSYFGKYNKCVVLTLSVAGVCVDLLPADDYTIGGVTFKEYREGFFHGISVWVMD